jgi:hypothetical protein
VINITNAGFPISVFHFWGIAALVIVTSAWQIAKTWFNTFARFWDGDLSLGQVALGIPKDANA